MLIFPEKALQIRRKNTIELFQLQLAMECIWNVTKEATLTVQNPNIADIHNGELTAKKPGSTTIYVSYQGQETSFQVDVEEGPKEIAYPMNGYKHFGEQSNVDSDKTWTVKFNADIDSYLSDSEVYVLNRFGEKEINFMEQVDNQSLKVYPPLHGYKAGETYYLVIEKDFQHIKGKKLKEAVTFKFTIAK